MLTVKTTLTWKDSNDFFQSKNLYTNVRKPLITLLATAYLEVFHAVVKLVPSNPSIVFMQVFARFICVVGVVDVFKVVIDNLLKIFVLSESIHPDFIL